MPLFLKRLSWVLVRTAIVVLTLTAMLTGSLSAFALGPLYSWMLYRDWRFWRYLRTFPRLTWQAWRLVGKLAGETDYRGMTAFTSWRDWIGAPMSGPDKSLVAVRRNWPHAETSCGDCGRCCTEIACPSFDAASKLCASYDSPFWRYFPCGRYPATQAQIDYYGCPKWVLLEPNAQASAGAAVPLPVPASVAAEGAQ
jgi:hypothetical protein